MRAIALRLGAASLAVMFLASVSMAQKMERGAFLRKPANSRAQLMAQIERDPVVMKRYERHFGMTEDQVRKYFSGMEVSTLPAGGRYLVWHVDPNGVMETKWLNLKKGMPVYLDKTGRVALKLNCGNPMIDSTVAKRVIQEQVAVQPPPVEIEQAFVPTPPTVAEIVPPPAVIVPEIEPAIPPAPMVLAAAPIIPAAIAAVPSVGGGGFNAWPLLLLGGAFVGGGGGGGGGGSPPPVPEPGTLIAVGAGIAMIVRKRRQK